MKTNGTHRGVEKQLLSETKFTHWFDIPGIQYIETEESEELEENSEMSSEESSAPSEEVSSIPSETTSAMESEV